MALFNLTNITFAPPGSAKGPLAPLTGNKEYERNTYRYPSDLGSSDKAHYMVININKQRLTSYAGINATDTPQAIKNNINNGSFAAGTSRQLNYAGQIINQVASGPVGTAISKGTTSISNFFGQIDNNLARFTQGALGVGQGGFSALIDGATALQTNTLRAQTRITDTVALYMPDTLAFSQSQNFENIQAGGIAAGVLSGGESVINAIKQGGNPADIGKKIGVQITPFVLSQLAKNAGGIFQVAFSQAFGVVQNPMLEVLYSSPSFRTFRFDFQFYPRSEKEAEEVQNIIQRLRFHQAPEVAQGGTNGFFLVPPSEFDISFYYNGQINPNIPKISTCVLEAMDVDYAPGGFSAYEVPNQKAKYGGTGMPVSIRLGLQFKETEIMTKNSFNNETSLAKNVGDARALEIIEKRTANDIP
jgi:hypothetical protein